MGFSKGTDSVAGESFKLYTGVAPVTIEAINPTAEQLSKLYGRPVEKIAEYTGTDKNGNQYARVDIIVKVNEKTAESIGVNEQIFGRISFFLRPEPRKNTDGTKVQVINEFGQTAWVTAEILTAMAKPLKNDGSEMNNYHLPYRPCVPGEDDIVSFLIAYLGVPSLVKYVDNQPVAKTGAELEECYASFSPEELKKILKGDAAPLKEILAARPNNEVFVLFAISSSADNNNKYQQVLSSFFAKGKDTKARERFQTEINKNQRIVNNLEYTIPFKEYKEEPTEIPTQKATAPPETLWG